MNEIHNKKTEASTVKKSKKKNILIAIELMLIAIIIFSMYAYSRYSSKVNGTGTATIAKWSFKVNGQKEQVQEIKLVSTYNSETLVNNKIAPGTSGSFNIIVDATGSEVGIKYNIKFAEESNKPQNLKFVYGGKEYDSIKQLGDELSGTIAANEEDKTRTINVQWKWNYETGSSAEQINANDIIDTNDAISIANYTFQVIVTGTQVEPQA